MRAYSNLCLFLQQAAFFDWLYPPFDLEGTNAPDTSRKDAIYCKINASALDSGNLEAPNLLHCFIFEHWVSDCPVKELIVR